MHFSIVYICYKPTILLLLAWKDQGGSCKVVFHVAHEIFNINFVIIWLYMKKIYLYIRETTSTAMLAKPPKKRSHFQMVKGILVLRVTLSDMTLWECGVCFQIQQYICSGYKMDWIKYMPSSMFNCRPQCSRYYSNFRNSGSVCSIMHLGGWLIYIGNMMEDTGLMVTRDV
jgi:hypothetical protein